MSFETNFEADAQAFDDCTVRRLEPISDTMTALFGSPSGNRLLQVTCPRYSDGSPFVHERELSNPTSRGAAAFRLGCKGCEFAQGNPDQVFVDNMYSSVGEAAGQLFLQRMYPQAVEASHQVVKHRLKDLTGYERVWESYGKGGLVIPVVSRDEEVNDDHQKSVKSLLEAIHHCRNEVTHEKSAPNAERFTRGVAIGQLSMASLAMRYLEHATGSQHRVQA